MTELVQESLRFYNLPITVCFVLVLVFWVLTVVGIMDTDSLEPDLDLDMDADVDAGGGSLGLGLLRFFNVGEVPVLVLVSVLISLVWAGAIWSNHALNAGGVLPDCHWSATREWIP